jgi:predicted ATPase/class 3 adenylate cyclase
VTEAPVVLEVRKVVTVLFSDVTESTALGHELDPESLRRIMTEYFEKVRLVLEQHGGVVEKFIGDAVMAVFGIPRAHEDDALRAVRAAAEIREALTRLNEEFERSWGVKVAARTGVNTGEVIAGDPNRAQSFVVGDAVNVAARLEQAAHPGEILIGEATYNLVREAVSAQAAGPLTLKGKPDPVLAWRLLEVKPGALGWTRRLDSTLVGREQELIVLEQSFDRVAEKGASELISVMGAAGVGKSRLISEFLKRIAGRATVVRGSCVPYGEGITFWPIASVIKEAAGIGEQHSPEEARWKIAGLIPGGDEATVIGDRLAALLGLARTTPGLEETFWAIRKLFEHLSMHEPLVVVFDDIHWAEPTFLDLLEYLADWISSSPVFLVCLTRGELLDSRPNWIAGRANAALVRLEPLTELEMNALIRNLIGRAEFPGKAARRIAEVAEGNPLFVEETLRMLVDEGRLEPRNGGWVVAGDLSAISIPPTINAILTARLDRLGPMERAVIERASIVGRVFSWSAVSELCSAEIRSEVINHLQSLTRKELIQPERTERQEDAFRFAHALVREAVYAAIPKAVRAELHERLAELIETEARARAGEYEAIIGYHREQAYRLLRQLGSLTDRIEDLGVRAALDLALAGKRAFARGDMPAAVNLLSRGASLLPETEPERLELTLQLAFALMETGDFERLEAVLKEMREAAGSSRDAGLRARVVIIGLWVRLWTDPEGWAAEAEREATQAIDVFEKVDDQEGLAKTWSLLGLIYGMKAQFGAGVDAWENAAAHARRVGDRRNELESLSWVPLFVWASSTPSGQGLERCRVVIEQAAGDRKAVSSAFAAKAAFEAGLGRFTEARELVAQAKALLREVALTVWLAGPIAQFAGWVELLAGDPAAAERELRSGYEKLGEIGELAWLSTVSAILAESVYAQERYDEAEQLTHQSEDASGTDDAYSQALLRSVRAKALARRGQKAEAERLAWEAVAFADTTDFLHLRWHSLMSQAEVLQLAGRGETARHALSKAIRLAEQKGSVVAARRARDLLADL